MGVGGLLPERIKAMVEMNAYTHATLDQLIYDSLAIEMSDTTISMLVDTVLDFERDNQPLKEMVHQIALVISDKESTIGADFDARVHEALSFTPDPFAPY